MILIQKCLPIPTWKKTPKGGMKIEKIILIMSIASSFHRGDFNPLYLPHGRPFFPLAQAPLLLYLFVSDVPSLCSALPP
jgi:hypothetical protein